MSKKVAKASSGKANSSRKKRTVASTKKQTKNIKLSSSKSAQQKERRNPVVISDITPSKRPMEQPSEKTKKTKNEERPLSRLQKLTLTFFKNPLKTGIAALVIVIFGVLSFTNLLQREGFPSIDVPYAVGQAAYFVNDPAKTDDEIAKPLSEFILKEDSVKAVNSTAQANFAVVMIQYNDSVDAVKETARLSKLVESSDFLPPEAKIKLEPSQMGFTENGDDAVLSMFNERKPGTSTAELSKEAVAVESFLNRSKPDLVEKFTVIEPFETAINPVNGEEMVEQKSFERYGIREGDSTKWYHGIAIGVKGKKGSDKIELDSQLKELLKKYESEQSGSGYRLAISASYADSINQQMNELGKTLIEGLLAVLIVGSLIITFRSSLITVLSMVVVILTTFGVLYAIGYSLNTITLFTLILGLALIVDDTIIMVEAIDKERRRSKNRLQVVSTAVRKVSRAMIAATLTAALSFAPLLFVGGIIGDFVRAVPITIITALLVSLIVALIVIPLLARYIMLSPKQIGEKKESRSARVEIGIAKLVTRPMLWARHNRRKEIAVGVSAVLVGLMFIGGGVLIASKVKFNIFPPTKDTNEIGVSLQFAPDTTISHAEELTDEVVDKISDVIGSDFEQASAYGNASDQGANLVVRLVDYSKREPTAFDYINNIEKEAARIEGVSVSARTIDVGPPASNFEARVYAGDKPEEARRLAQDITKFLKEESITRADGSQIEFDSVTLSIADARQRNDGRLYEAATASFVSDDTSTLIAATQAAVEKEFTEQKVSSYGLPKDALSFDIGTEADNQDSFKALMMAFPVLMLVIYLVLAIEFRSFLQPLLVFLAIPFSFFGITVGLWLTDNAFSFFAMLGFFALIGLSLKNTILLTDYANQARARGADPLTAAHDAVLERFRPLIATSLTAIVSLIPLALASPFWQALCVVLIGGLLSSTFLVITVFPYYYLGAEFIRLKLTRRRR